MALFLHERICSVSIRFSTFALEHEFRFQSRRDESSPASAPSRRGSHLRKELVCLSGIACREEIVHHRGGKTESRIDWKLIIDDLSTDDIDIDSKLQGVKHYAR